MIIRLWSARTTPAQSPIYLQHFSDAVLPALRKFNGYVSSRVLTLSAGNAIEIVVMTAWQSLASIDAFAGPDREAAVVAPEAAALLMDFDSRVRHFDLVLADGLTFPQ